MARYPNGRVPRDQLVEADGCLWFPGTRAKFVALRDRVERSHGVTLYVSPRAYGASNAYRPLDEQESARSALGIGASVPGYSSHGGDWSGNTTGRYGLARYVEHLEAGAIDIANFASIPWADFERACHEVGLLVDVTVPQERWHVVDLTPWEVPTDEGEDMFTDQDRAKLNAAYEALCRDGKEQDDWSIAHKVDWLVRQTVTILPVIRSIASAVGWLKNRVGGSVKKGAENLTEMIRSIR